MECAGLFRPLGAPNEPPRPPARDGLAKGKGFLGLSLNDDENVHGAVLILSLALACDRCQEALDSSGVPTLTIMGGGAHDDDPC